MNNTMMIKELLTHNKRILTGLHDSFGYDFNKPLWIFQNKIPFTAKSILPEFVLGREREYKIVALTKRSTFCNPNYLLAMIYHYKDRKFYCNDDERRIVDTWQTGLDTMWRKGDYEDVRKGKYDNIGNNVYLLIQRISDTATPKRKKAKPCVVIGERFKVYDVRFQYCNNKYRVGTYIYRMELKHEREKERISYSNTSETWNEFDIFDKSGYCVEIYRNNLKKRAYDLKAKREKEAFNNTDHTKEIDACELLFNLKRKEVLEIAQKAESKDDYEKVTELFGCWHGLEGARSALDYLRLAYNEGRFRSNEDFEADLNRVIAKVNDIAKGA